MIITYHGRQFFRIQTGDTVLAFNPISQEVGTTKVAKFGANVALATVQDPRYNGFDTVTYGDTKPFTIDGPGAYEVGDLFVRGVVTDNSAENALYNTMYTFWFDGISVVFLGAISGKKAITNDVREAVTQADVIFVPIGGPTGISPNEAHAVAVSFNPSLIIPMEFEGKNDKNLVQFIKESGGADTVDKLTIKPKDIEGKESDVVVITE